MFERRAANKAGIEEHANKSGGKKLPEAKQILTPQQRRARLGKGAIIAVDPESDTPRSLSPVTFNKSLHCDPETAIEKHQVCLEDMPLLASYAGYRVLDPYEMDADENKIIEEMNYMTSR